MPAVKSLAGYFNASLNGFQLLIRINCRVKKYAIIVLYKYNNYKILKCLLFKNRFLIQNFRKRKVKRAWIILIVSSYLYVLKKNKLKE